MISETMRTSPDRRKSSRRFENNLLALRIGRRTRKMVREASPVGVLSRLADGNLAVTIDDEVLGAPADERSRAQSLADIGGMGRGIVVVFGLGSGTTVRELRERTSHQLVVFEPDPGILRTVLDAGPCDLGNIPIVSDLSDLKMVWVDMAKGNPKATVVTTPGYAERYQDIYNALDRKVQTFVDNVSINENTHYVRGKTWLKDAFANLPVVRQCPPFLALAGQFKNVPAFIVAAGPSLNKNGPLLREAVKKGIVIAVNTSGKALAHHGVVPQVLACIESIDLSAELRKLPFLDDVVRAFSLSGSPEAMRTGNGPLLPIHEQLPSFRGFEKLLGVPGLPIGSSVSTAAFALAERLGCSPIVFVGQDLAYPEGQAYAAGSAFENSRTVVDRETGTLKYQWCDTALEAHGLSAGPLVQFETLQEVPAWGGEGIVPTSACFTGVRSWLELAAEVMQTARPEVRLINATEGGSRIENFEEQKLADVLMSLPDMNLTAQAIAEQARALHQGVSETEWTNWIEEQKDLLHCTARSARRVERAARAAIEAMRAEDPKRISRAFRLLDRTEKLLKLRSERQTMIDTWASAELQKLEAQAGALRGGDARSEAEHGLCKEAEVAAVIAQAAEEIRIELGEMAKTSPADPPQANR